MFLFIPRLISEHTVEENILKKAKQKRLLGDLAIEGGGFTTDFFKQVSLSVTVVAILMYLNHSHCSVIFVTYLALKMMAILSLTVRPHLRLLT